MPSNHISNEPYHDWLKAEGKRKAKEKEMQETIGELASGTLSESVVNEVMQLERDRNELAAMLASALGTKEKLKEFIHAWNEKKKSS